LSGTNNLLRGRAWRAQGTLYDRFKEERYTFVPAA
jgi:hypothetical protein